MILHEGRGRSRSGGARVSRQQAAGSVERFDAHGPDGAAVRRNRAPDVADEAAFATFEPAGVAAARWGQVAAGIFPGALAIEESERVRAEHGEDLSEAAIGSPEAGAG